MGLAPFAGLWLQGLGLGSMGVPEQARAEPLAIPMECRMASGPWQACQMEVIELGRHWFVVFGGRRFEFRHDERGGAVEMGEAGRWVAVSSRWEPDQSLCWGSVCVRGDIPLD